MRMKDKQKTIDSGATVRRGGRYWDGSKDHAGARTVLNDLRQPVRSPIWCMKCLTSGSFLEKHRGAETGPRRRQASLGPAKTARRRATTAVAPSGRRGPHLITSLHGVLRRIVASVVTLKGSGFTGQSEKLVGILTIFARPHRDPEFPVALIRPGICHSRDRCAFLMPLLPPQRAPEPDQFQAPRLRLNGNTMRTNVIGRAQRKPQPNGRFG